MRHLWRRFLSSHDRQDRFVVRCPDRADESGPGQPKDVLPMVGQTRSAAPPISSLSDGSGCWRADCRSAATARPEEAAIRSRWQHDAVPPWRRVEPTMVCEVRVTNLDLLVVRR